MPMNRLQPWTAAGSHCSSVPSRCRNEPSVPFRTLSSAASLSAGAWDAVSAASCDSAFEPIFRIVEMSPDSESIQQQKPSISQRSMENGRNRICTMRVQARVRTRSNEM